MSDGQSTSLGCVMGSAANGGIMLAVLLILHRLLYLILRLEDDALQAGALAGSIMLAATVYLFLGIGWSGSKAVAAAEPASN